MKSSLTKYIEQIPEDKIQANILQQLMLQNRKLKTINKHLTFYTVVLIITLVAAIAVALDSSGGF